MLALSTPALTTQDRLAAHQAAAAAVAWEVDDADGTAIYRGTDLVLADELYGLVAGRGGHLVPLTGADATAAAASGARAGAAG
jgi:hypothetical protein